MSLPDADDLGRLGDVVAFGKQAIRHLGNLSAEEFAQDEKTIDSVVRVPGSGRRSGLEALEAALAGPSVGTLASHCRHAASTGP